MWTASFQCLTICNLKLNIENCAHEKKFKNTKHTHTFAKAIESASLFHFIYLNQQCNPIECFNGLHKFHCGSPLFTNVHQIRAICRNINNESICRNSQSKQQFHCIFFSAKEWERHSAWFHSDLCEMCRPFAIQFSFSTVVDWFLSHSLI